MPVWLHRKASKDAARIYATDGAKCLKTKHQTHYMKQLTELLETAPVNHRQTNYCMCTLCKEMSSRGCTHPHKCLETARKLMDALAPKWRPRNRTNPDNNDLGTPTTAEENLGEGVTVSTVREETNLRDSIRIFTDRKNLLDATTLPVQPGEAGLNTELTVYTDGSCTNNGTEDARAGSGVWYGPLDPRNMAIRVPGDKQSNQIGELLAVLYAVKNAPGNRPLRIKSDSEFAIKGLTKYAKDWEAKDWIGISHSPLFKCITAWLRARTSTTMLQWVKGHTGIEGNEEADRLAAEGALKEPDQEGINLQIPADTMTTGAALQRTSQSMIYGHLTNNEDIR